MSTSNANPTPAQSLPDDPRLTALKAQTAILGQQQQQMDALLKMQLDQQGMLTGLLPTSNTAPQSGAVTVSGTNAFESQRLAYESLKSVGAEVAKAVKTTGPVLVYDLMEMNSLVNYGAVTQILASLQQQVADLKRGFSDDLSLEIQVLLAQSPATPAAKKAFAPILVPGLVLGGLKTLSDIMGMFRTNTNIAFSSFNTDDVALTAAVAHALIASGKVVFQSAVMPIDATGVGSGFMNSFAQVQKDLLQLQHDATVGQVKMQQLSDALGAFIQADQAVQANTDATKAAALNATRDSAGQFAQGLFTPNPAGDTLPPLTGAIANALKSERDRFLKELTLFVTSVSTMVTVLSTLQTSLMTVTNTGTAALTGILRAEKLMAQVQMSGATILVLKTSVLGGSVVTRTNLLSTKSYLRYSGGAIVNYALFDSTGKVTASDVVVSDTKLKPDSF
jgi:hypothetical protein